MVFPRSDVHRQVDVAVRLPAAEIDEGSHFFESFGQVDFGARFKLLQRALSADLHEGGVGLEAVEFQMVGPEDPINEENDRLVPGDFLVAELAREAVKAERSVDGASLFGLLGDGGAEAEGPAFNGHAFLQTERGGERSRQGGEG